jgi:hypothetical protein
MHPVYINISIRAPTPRYTAIIGPRLRARGFAAQQTEAAIGCAVINRSLQAGRPNSVRIKANAL